MIDLCYSASILETQVVDNSLSLRGSKMEINEVGCIVFPSLSRFNKSQFPFDEKLLIF